MVAVARRVGLAGLATMLAVLISAAIWPVVAAIVTTIFVVVGGGAIAVPVALAVRWAWRARAQRRELETMPSTSGSPECFVPAAAMPTMHELRESA